MELDIVDIGQDESTKHDLNSGISINDETALQNAKQLLGLDDHKDFPR